MEHFHCSAFFNDTQLNLKVVQNSCRKSLKHGFNIHQLMTTASENLKKVAVSDFMTRKVKVITENETMRQACKLMYQHNIGSIIIITVNQATQQRKRYQQEYLPREILLE